jgi:hypothetical protein
MLRKPLPFLVLVFALLITGCMPEPAIEPRVEIAKSRDQITKGLFSTYAERLGAQLPNAEFELRVSQRSEPVSMQASSAPFSEMENKISGKWITLSAPDSRLVSTFAAPKGNLADIGDALEVQLQHLRGVPRCGVTINGGLSGSQPTNQPQQSFQRTFVTGQTNWRTLRNLNVNPANLRPRELTYTIGRSLGASADDDWRYFQSANVMFYSQRTAIDASSAMSLQIVTAADATPSNVALRLTHKSTGASAGVIDLGPPSERKVELGEAGNRYNISEQLRARKLVGAGGVIDAEIVEVVVQFAGMEPKAALEKRALRSVLVQASDALDPSASSVAFNETGMLAGQSVWRVPLRPLLPNNTFDVAFSELKVAIAPPSSGSCTVRLDGVRVIDRYDGKGPYHVVNNIKHVAARGAELFPGQFPYDGQRLPALEHLAFVPITEPTIDRDAQRRFEKNCSGRNSDSSATRDTDFINIAEFSGAQISSCGGIRLTQEKDGATRIQLREGSAQISLPVAVRGAESAYLYLLGSSDQTTDSRAAVTATVSLLSAGKVSSSQPLPLQQAIEIAGLANANVLVVNLTSEVPMSSIVIQRIELFRPVMLDHGTSFAHKTPEQTLANLRKTDSTQIQTAGAIFSDINTSGDSSITGLVALDAPIALPQGSQLTVSIPPDFAPEDECWITIKPIWGDRSGEAVRVCGQSAGVVRPLPRGLLSPPPDSVQSPLSALEITARTRKLPTAGAESRLQMAVVGKVSGVGFISARDTLARSGLVRNAKEIRSTLRPDTKGLDSLARGMTSITLRSPELSDQILSNWMEAIANTSSALHVRSLAVVNPKEAVEAGVWKRTLRPVAKPKSSLLRWLGLSVFGALVAISAIGYRYREHPRAKDLMTKLLTILGLIRDKYRDFQPTLFTAVSWLCVIAAAIGSGWKAGHDPAWPQATVFGGALLAGWLLLPAATVRARTVVYTITALVYCAWALPFAASKPLVDGLPAVLPVFALAWAGARVVLAAGSRTPHAIAKITLPLLIFFGLVVASIRAIEPVSKSNLSSYATIAITITLARFLHEGWPWFTRRIPRLATLDYLADRGGKYGIIAILALLFTASFTALGYRSIAEYTAMVAYFALWGMLLHRLYGYFKDRADKSPTRDLNTAASKLATP